MAPLFKSKGEKLRFKPAKNDVCMDYSHQVTLLRHQGEPDFEEKPKKRKSRRLTGIFKKKDSEYENYMPVKGHGELDEFLSRGYQFVVLDLSETELAEAAVEMLHHFVTPILGRNFDSSHKQLKAALYETVREMKESHFRSSFHNFYHAVGRTQLLHMFLSEHLSQRIPPSHMFFLLFISLCRDINFPGTSDIETLHESGMLTEYETLGEYRAEMIQNFVDSNPFINTFMHVQLKVRFLKLIDSVLNYTLDGKSMLDISENTSNLLHSEHFALLLEVCDSGHLTRPYGDSRIWSEALVVETEAFKQLKTFEICDVDTLAEIWETLIVLQRRERYRLSSESENLGSITMKNLEERISPLQTLMKNIDKEMSAEYDHQMSLNAVFFSLNASSGTFSSSVWK